MTFTGNRILGDDPVSGNYDVRTNAVTYEANYELTTNSASDEAQLAIAYVQTNIAGWGSPYRLGNGRRDSAVLTNIRVTRYPKDNEHWKATLTYSDPTESDRVDQNGNLSDNPLDWRPIVDVATVQYSRAAVRAKYLSGYGPTSQQIILDRQQVDPDQKFVICNSSIEPYDPPMEGDHSRSVITLKRNASALAMDTVKNNVVNKNDVFLDYRGLFKKIDKYTGKTRGLRVGMNTYRTQDGGLIDYLDVSIEIEVYDDGDETWHIRPLDQGFLRRGLPGDPDGKGGTYTQGEKATGVSQMDVIKDVDGNPCTVPHMLNGDGQEFNLDATQPQFAVYSEWQYYTEAAYESWPIFQGILT